MPEVALSAKQLTFCREKSRFPLYRGAIRSGKTYAGAVRSIDRRYRFPGTVQIVAGPSWDQLRDGTMVTLRRLINPACIVEENKNEHYWRLDNSSMFRFRTLDDPDVLRSLEAHDLWIDEIAMCSQYALDVAMPRISLPYPDPAFVNSLWGTTTPKGMDWTLDVWGWEGKPELGYSVVHSTIFDNAPHLPTGLIASLEAKYEGTPFYEQELLGMYTAFEGLVYPTFRKDKHVTGIPCDLRECRLIVVGIDFGGITPTAMELLGERGSGRIHDYDEMYRTGATLPDIVSRLQEWSIRAGRAPDIIACDGSEPVAIATIRAAGFNAVAADKDRDSGIKLVQQRLAPSASGPGLTFSPECAGVISEFGMYVWASRRDAATKIARLTDQPIDHHGDALDALRYGVMALGQVQPAPVAVTGRSGRVYAGR